MIDKDDIADLRAYLDARDRGSTTASFRLDSLRALLDAVEGPLNGYHAQGFVFGAGLMFAAFIAIVVFVK